MYCFKQVQDSVPGVMLLLHLLLKFVFTGSSHLVLCQEAAVYHYRQIQRQGSLGRGINANMQECIREGIIQPTKGREHGHLCL